MKKDLVIIGCGGVGIEVALLAEETKNYRVLGFVDDNESRHGDFILGYPVLGSIDDLINFTSNLDVCVAISDCEIKKSIVDKLMKSTHKFATLVHPSVRLNRTISLGTGVIIYAGSIITANVVIEDHVLLSPGCMIGHGSVIGEFSSLLWGVKVSGDVVIEERSYLGSGSTILQNLVVMEQATVGAGALVTKNVEKRATVIGIPAKAI